MIHVMRYRTLGDSGLLVSVVGLGCNNFGGRLDSARTRAVVDAAIDAGITLFDTADMYGRAGGSELALGEALQGRRDQVVLATKFGHQGADLGYGPAAGAKGGRKYIKIAAEKSLARLRTDYIDLYQLHTPDPLTPVDETIAALDELVVEGKIRYFGHSNLPGWQIAEAHLTASLTGRRHFVSAQDEYSLIARGVEQEVLPAVRRFGLGFLPYFPFANGLFTGKFSRTELPADSRIARQRPYIHEQAPWDAIEALSALASERGAGLLEVTVAWFLARPSVSSVIAGATRPEQVRQNSAAADVAPLTPGELARIDALFPA